MKAFLLVLPLALASYCKSGLQPIWETSSYINSSSFPLSTLCWVNQTFSTPTQSYLRQITVLSKNCQASNVSVHISSFGNIIYSTYVMFPLTNRSFIDIDVSLQNISLSANNLYSLVLFSDVTNNCVNLYKEPIEDCNEIGIQNQLTIYNVPVLGEQLVGAICVEPIQNNQYCTCGKQTIECMSDCSSKFCFCSNGVGYIMDTASGTRCRNGTQIFENVCFQSNTPIPSNPGNKSKGTSKSKSTNPEGNTQNSTQHPVNKCSCVKPGVNCLYNCSSAFCLCSETGGQIIQTAEGTVCNAGYQTWVNDQVCSNNRSQQDGFRCTGRCSMLYYYYVNGQREQDQFTPAGTVCSADSIVHPETCIINQTKQVQSCSITGWNCLLSSNQICSNRMYYCKENVAYVEQNTPPGTLCYRNTIVPANSDPCFTSNSSYTDFQISISTESEWNVLTQVALTNSVYEGMYSVDPSIQISGNDVHIMNAQNEGRRLLRLNQQTIRIYSDLKDRIRNSFDRAIQLNLVQNALIYRHINMTIGKTLKTTFTVNPVSYIAVYIGCASAICLIGLIIVYRKRMFEPSKNIPDYPL